MAWNTQARGIGLNDSHTSVVIPEKGCDFVVSSMGKWNVTSETFPAHVQAAYNAKVPILGTLSLDTEPYHDSDINDYGRWASMEDDVHIKALDKMLKSGDVMRAVHGLIFSITKTKNSDGRTYTTSAWVARVAERIIDLAWRRYSLPIWLFETWAAYKSIPDDSGILSNVLTNQGEIASLQLASGMTGTWGNIGFPPDTWKMPNIYAPTTKWALYSAGAVSLEGINAPVELWLFNGPKASCYGALNYTEPPSTGDGGTTDHGGGTTDPGTPGGTTIDTTSIVAAIDRNTAQLKRIADRIE